MVQSIRSIMGKFFCVFWGSMICVFLLSCVPSIYYYPESLASKEASKGYVLFYIPTSHYIGSPAYDIKFNVLEYLEDDNKTILISKMPTQGCAIAVRQGIHTFIVDFFVKYARADVWDNLKVEITDGMITPVEITFEEIGSKPHPVFLPGHYQFKPSYFFRDPVPFVDEKSFRNVPD